MEPRGAAAHGTLRNVRTRELEARDEAAEGRARRCIGEQGKKSGLQRKARKVTEGFYPRKRHD